MIVAEEDTVVPPALAIAAYTRAREPKRLVTFKGSHYGAYDIRQQFDLCSSEAISWFHNHLRLKVES
jgi:hypothetical protein